MVGRRVAVLGCGYVGMALIERLTRAGHECVGTTTTPARVDEIRATGARCVVIELAEADRLRELLIDREIVYLLVAAGARRRDYRGVYLDGAKSVLRAAAGSAVQRIVYTSSTGVYGQDDGSWVDEDSLTEPTSENGGVLLEAEKCLLGSTASVAVLRLSGIYGPGRDPVTRVTRNAGCELNNGDAYVNLIHRDDIVAALVALVDTPYTGVLNLSDDCPTTRRTYYDELIAAAGAVPIRWVNDAESPGPGKRVRNARVKKALHLTLAHPVHTKRGGSDPPR